MECGGVHVLLHDEVLHLTIIEGAIEGRTPPGIPKKFLIHISTEERCRDRYLHKISKAWPMIV